MRRFVWIAMLAALAAAPGCGSSSSSLEESEFDVGAEVVTDLRDPIPGVQVQVWIVDVDLPGPQRTPIPMNPRITTNAEGLAMWTYVAETEPTICGYEVFDDQGTLLREEVPDVRKDFGPRPSRVMIMLDL